MRIPLNGMDIWVRLYDVPLRYVNETMAKLMGNYIGIFISYDTRNKNEVWEDFMRVRVKIDVRKPLKQYKMFIKRDGSTAKIRFMFERLPSFCFVCGIIGHFEKQCKVAYGLDSKGKEPIKGWGVNLRAPTRVKEAKQPGQWERDATGSQAAGHAVEEEETKELERARAGGGENVETVVRPETLAALKGKSHVQRNDFQEKNMGYVNPLYSSSNEL